MTIATIVVAFAGLLVLLGYDPRAAVVGAGAVVIVAGEVANRLLPSR